MKQRDNQILKLAIQKEGRLTQGTINFLRRSGLEFEASQRRLFSQCLNFPLEILYVRDDDIGNYVEEGTVDLGIIGQNLLFEKRPRVKKLLNLRFAFCSLIIAVPKDSTIKTITDLRGSKIATAYPQSTRVFFKKKDIKVNIMRISGAVEITPALGVAQAVVDLTSTGSTLALNDLRIIKNIYDSEAVLIANSKAIKAQSKKPLIEKLILRFKGVLSAKKYKLVAMNAPEKILPRLTKIIPGLRSPSITPLTKPGWLNVSSVIKEDIFWETIEKIKKLGATEITVSPIEKIIT